MSATPASGKSLGPLRRLHRSWADCQDTACDTFDQAQLDRAQERADCCVGCRQHMDHCVCNLVRMWPRALPADQLSPRE